MVTHSTRKAGLRSLERAIGGIVHYRAVSWVAHVDEQGLPPSSSPPAFPQCPRFPPFDSLVRRSKDGGAGCNSVAEADELEFLRCRVMTARTESASRDGESFGALS